MKDLTPAGAVARISIAEFLDRLKNSGFETPLVTWSEVFDIVKEVAVWAAFQAEHELPLRQPENPEVLAGETITDPKDKVRLGTVDSKRYFLHPRKLLPPLANWRKFFWDLAQLCARALTSDKLETFSIPSWDASPENLAKISEYPRTVARLGRTIRALNRELRRKK